MKVSVEWEKRAQHDRENIFLYLNREAGTLVAIAADERLAGMAA
ncbi:type II toxin-antitoxin system RelE/ParE family toxin, partial [Salmonella enterica]|nr:type II toxin-antitoxin system RelE/ParE family toxin [Salmonella enterica]